MGAIYIDINSFEKEVVYINRCNKNLPLLNMEIEALNKVMENIFWDAI